MTVQELRDKGYIIFESIAGSKAYGTDISTSDTDIRGVYVLPNDYLLGCGQYVEQVADSTNDVVFYELNRFVALLQQNNPNLLELLFMPDECITYKNELWDILTEDKEKFLTKICKNSFGGYAIQQIKKARGLKKKIVNPVEKERKSPLDFCYAHFGYNSTPLSKYLEENGLEQKFCGVANIPHAKDLYGMFYDYNSHNAFSENNPTFPFPQIYIGDWISEHQESWKNKCLEDGTFLHYKGIMKESEDGTFPSNELRMSHIDKFERINMLTYFSYNQDGYTKYCKDYKEYWEWHKNKNESRYLDNINNGSKFDTKNMMHCHRLLNMSIEIAKEGVIKVRRPDANYLLDIRKGKYEYEYLLSDAEIKIMELDIAFENSDLPLNVKISFCNELILKIRSKI